MSIRYTSEFPTKENLYHLYDVLGWNDFLKLSPEQLLTAMKQSWYSIYVYSEENLIATGRVISDGMMNAYLCGLGVSADFRNKGIGTEIIRRLLTHGKENKLHVQFFCEEHLIPLYEKMGFEVFAAGIRMKENH